MARPKPHRYAPRRLLTLCACLRASLSVGWDAHGGMGVLDLSAQSWTGVVDGRHTVLVAWHVPWCPECRALDAKLESAAQQLLPDVQIAKVNAEEEPGLKMRYRVHDYPELHLFLPGASEPLSYMGELATEQIVRWVRDTQRTGPPVAASGGSAAPAGDPSWMRSLAEALDQGTGCRGGRCHDPPAPPTVVDEAGGPALASQPDGQGSEPPSDADGAMRMAMDDAVHDAAAGANAKAMQVTTQLQLQEAAMQRQRQQQAAAAAAGAASEVLPLLPTLKAMAASPEFRDLAQARTSLHLRVWSPPDLRASRHRWRCPTWRCSPTSSCTTWAACPLRSGWALPVPPSPARAPPPALTLALQPEPRNPATLPP